MTSSGGAKLTFLGAVGTVTGSKYLVESGQRRILIDCGLFQGQRELRERNWARFPVDPKSIDAIVLTHAHLDHSGYIPLLVKKGYPGSIHCTDGTSDLCSILLPDSGFLQERDAEYANRHGFSRHKPALPLYTMQDAERSLKRFVSHEFDRSFELGGAKVRLRRAGHILGAAIVELKIDETKIVFSGDLGRPESPTMLPPRQIEGADYLVVESTYGDRRHDQRSPADVMAPIINRTVSRGGSIIIAAFAVGRVQELLYHIYQMKQAGEIRDLPLFVDSPMATDATSIYASHLTEHKLRSVDLRAAFSSARYVRDVEDSKALVFNPVPKIVISASGMATGGRILHHLKHLAADPRNTIIFSGFQASGTRGALILAGADRVSIHGEDVPIRAEVVDLPMLSAHADSLEIMDWLRGFQRAPRVTYVTHGEPLAAQTLRGNIESELGWNCVVPGYGDEVALPRPAHRNVGIGRANGR